MGEDVDKVSKGLGAAYLHGNLMRFGELWGIWTSPQRR
jgi:hypothetical protein